MPLDSVLTLLEVQVGEHLFDGFGPRIGPPRALTAGIGRGGFGHRDVSGGPLHPA
ncbi:hypothetical protein [Leekyejoonella antrihumi]|uniref:hypothetical protein n=1 Tax=Leekyejoonella antrihumi TaxID=1660198 RepID=UPI001FE4B6CA|nr:hypothetical protein [Leekyejoonella antrihumi]